MWRRLALASILGLLLVPAAVSGDNKPFQAPGADKAWFAYPSGDETLYLKWGDNHAGTPGGVVSWSLMPAGTPGDIAFCPATCAGLSQASIAVEVSPGGGFAPRTLAQLEAHILAALERWSAVTGIEFEQTADSGLPVNDPAAAPPASGHIRFGIFSFTTAGGAAGFAPPPNGGTGAGDVLLNANAFFQVAAGQEGDAFDQRFAPNDLPTLLLHEVGHAIGLAHPSFDGSCPVMQVHGACLGRINRELDGDDRASAIFLYLKLFGDGFEALPSMPAPAVETIRSGS